METIIKQSNYRIVIGNSPTQLMEIVNELLGKGYTICGGVCLTDSGAYVQALIGQSIINS